MEVACGGAQGTMSEQALKRVEIDAGFDDTAQNLTDNPMMRKAYLEL
jgi:hypothetical protein